MNNVLLFASSFTLLRFRMIWFCLLVALVTAISDPWATLGVPRSANQKDIKKAYKKLAIQWHPDKNQSPEAEEKFMEIAEAYQILTDDEKRREWERNQGQGQGTWFRSKSRGGGGFGFSADDIFKVCFSEPKILTQEIAILWRVEFRRRGHQH